MIIDSPQLYAATSLQMNPELLQLVDMSAMPAATLANLRAPIRMGQCYNNAFKVATDLMLDVVLGATILNDVGIAIEHAWVAEPGDDGKHYDPTFQAIFGKVGADTYLELYRIPIRRYLADMKALGTRKGIDIAALRRHQGTRHLFQFNNPTFPLPKSQHNGLHME